MDKPSTFKSVFERLRAILVPFAPYLTVKQDTDEIYYLDGPYSQEFKRELFFGSAHIKKNYTSFYLMPVYMYPELLETISLALKKRMQGKSCFNFKSVDEALFDELSELTRRSFERFRKETSL